MGQNTLKSTQSSQVALHLSDFSVLFCSQWSSGLHVFEMQAGSTAVAAAGMAGICVRSHVLASAGMDRCVLFGRQEQLL